MELLDVGHCEKIFERRIKDVILPFKIESKVHDTESKHFTYIPLRRGSIRFPHGALSSITHGSNRDQQ